MQTQITALRPVVSTSTNDQYTGYDCKTPAISEETSDDVNYALATPGWTNVRYFERQSEREPLREEDDVQISPIDTEQQRSYRRVSELLGAPITTESRRGSRHVSDLQNSPINTESRRSSRPVSDLQNSSINTESRRSSRRISDLQNLPVNTENRRSARPVSDLHGSQRFSWRLTDLGKKARGSISSLIGRKDSMFSNGDLFATEASTRSSLPSLYDPADTADTASYQSRQSRRMTRASLDTIEQSRRRSSRPDFHVCPFETRARIAAKLNEGVERGDFDEEVRDARFAALCEGTTEKQQWSASRDLIETVARRRDKDEATFEANRPTPHDKIEEVGVGAQPSDWAVLCC